MAYPVLPTSKNPFVEDDLEDTGMSGTGEPVDEKQDLKPPPENKRPGWEADAYKTMKKINKLAPDDYYGFLDLKKTCSVTEIKDQYKALALLTHPDKNRFPDAKKAFQREFLSSRY